MSMAVWVYYDEPGAQYIQGLPLVTKYGSYRWMVNPGQEWVWQHVHLGPGFGDLRHAKPNPSLPGFRIPVQKWICLAVSIDIDDSAGTATLHYYLNGRLWGPPSVFPETYTMDGSSDLYINTNSTGQYWKGMVDRFTLWHKVISQQEVNDYCNCPRRKTIVKDPIETKPIEDGPK